MIEHSYRSAIVTIGGREFAATDVSIEQDLRDAVEAIRAPRPAPLTLETMLSRAEYDELVRFAASLNNRDRNARKRARRARRARRGKR